jgi:hypothetical protein
VLKSVQALQRVVERAFRPERDDLQIKPQAPLTGDRGDAEVALYRVRLIAPEDPGLVHVTVDVEVEIRSLEALVAVHVEDDVLEPLVAEEVQELAMRPESVETRPRRARAAVRADCIVARR